MTNFLSCPSPRPSPDLRQKATYIYQFLTKRPDRGRRPDPEKAAKLGRGILDRLLPLVGRIISRIEIGQVNTPDF